MTLYLLASLRLAGLWYDRSQLFVLSSSYFVSLPHPHSQDGVLGGNAPVPRQALVLGGWAGIQQRFASPHVEQRLAALRDIRQFNSAELALLGQALDDPALEVQRLAYDYLRSRPESLARKALRHYSPYPLFTCLAVLTGHYGGVSAVAIEPNAQTVASGSRDGTLRVWDWQAGQEVFCQTVNSLIYRVSFSEDGRILTLYGQQHRSYAWDLRTGQDVEPEPATIGTLASVTHSRDRRTLISGSQNTIKVWDLRQGRQLCSLVGHRSLVTSVAVNSRRSLIVSGSEDKTVRVWGVPLD